MHDESITVLKTGSVLLFFFFFAIGSIMAQNSVQLVTYCP